MSELLQLSYVLPLRWSDETGREELTEYLGALRRSCAEILIVDGSSPDVFAANAEAWGSWTVHVAPDPDTQCKMGKVAGVTTGVRRAGFEAVVIADDDVRYERAGLQRLIECLRDHDLVRPQNFFDPLPWHARWDTARTLLNRALGADYPGTLGIRRSRFVGMGGYDGDVIFENLELIRSVQASGGTTLSPLDFFVRRLPPTTSHFWGQRTRQAYDDFALPLRMACWLAVVPLVLAMICRRRPTEGCLSAVTLALLAELGRRRGKGATVFPPSASLLAPLWVLERGACSWLAVAQRLRFGGVRYGAEVIPTAANSISTIRLVQDQRPAEVAARLRDGVG
ncbi:MAG TPA: glycosyltransferase family 2 protein [Solirubrobacteraceae bacterium]|nr:glycosyltransferase family 2 protein [Solirubrobacteraceae bacterium]